MQDNLPTQPKITASFAGDFLTILYSQLTIAYDVADKARQFAPESWQAEAEEIFAKVTDLLVQVDNIRP